MTSSQSSGWLFHRLEGHVTSCRTYVVFRVKMRMHIDRIAIEKCIAVYACLMRDYGWTQDGV